MSRRAATPRGKMPLQRYSTAAPRRKERNGLFPYRTHSFVRYARESTSYVSLNSTAILLTRVAPGASLSVCLSLSAPPSARPRFLRRARAVSSVTACERRRRIMPRRVHVYEDARGFDRMRAERKARAGTRLFARVRSCRSRLVSQFVVSSSIFQRFSCFSSLKAAPRGS